MNARNLRTQEVGAKVRQPESSLDPWLGKTARQSESPITVESMPEGLYNLIGRQCVALGLDLASRIFAQALAGAAAGVARPDSEMNQSVPVALEQWKSLVMTWQTAWGDHAAELLEHTGVAPASTQIAPVDHLRLVQPAEQFRLPAPPYPDDLTAREVEVLCLVACGLNNGEIAEKLFLSRRTVHAHLRSIYGKIGVNTRAAATRYAILHDLVA